MPSTDRPIIDHIGLAVSDLAKAKAFYDLALAPLGISLLMEIPASVTGDYAVAGYGRGKPELWLAALRKTDPRIHIALTAESRADVDAFYAAAIAAGGTDNGRPGLRTHYHPDYYGAFVLDPDGHNVEAVCHKPG
jgi:catechol 2,3-dioxygenase-like lactoylglutathione lyase family enzyme